jgi:hypothetical protein
MNIIPCDDYINPRKFKECNNYHKCSEKIRTGEGLGNLFREKKKIRLYEIDIKGKIEPEGVAHT